MTVRFQRRRWGLHILGALVWLAAGCGDDGPRTDADAVGSDADSGADDSGTDDSGTLDVSSDGSVATDAVDDGAIEDTATDGFDVRGLYAVRNPTNGLSWYVAWTTSVPADTTLEVDCGDEAWTIHGDVLGTDHEVFASGFWAGAQCTLTAIGIAADGAMGRASIGLEVEGAGFEVPGVEVVATRPEAMEPGWTLVDLSDARLRERPAVAMIDAAGRIRWVHRLDGIPVARGNQVAAHPEGVLTGGMRNSPARFVTWEGRETWRATFDSHHEGFRMPDGERFVHLEPRQPCPDGIPAVAPVVMRDYASQDVLWRWMLCDHVAPPTPFQDWDHNNGIAFAPDESWWVLSARHQNALYAVDTASGELLWTMGFGGRPDDGFAGDFAMAEEDRFLEQHAPQILDDGHIVLFDNGSCTACPDETEGDWRRESSRAIEIAWDADAGTAAVVWEFVPEPPIHAEIWGDADRLPGGTTLVTFGRKAETTYVIEADAAGEEVWRMSYTRPAWGSYRAERVPPVYGFVTLPQGE